MEITARPWGNFSTIAVGDNYKIKILYIKKGEMISLQYHEKRIERWQILKGKGIIDVNFQKENVQKDNYIRIPMFVPHRVEAIEDLTILEIQEGECDETDIVRLEDKYGRSN